MMIRKTGNYIKGKEMHKDKSQKRLLKTNKKEDQ